MRFPNALRLAQHGLVDWSKVTCASQDTMSVLENYSKYRYDHLIDKIIKDAKVHVLSSDNVDMLYLMKHEMVRPVESTDVLLRRMSGGRKMYGLIHESIPMTPIIFCSTVSQTGPSLQGFLDGLHEPGQDTNMDSCDTVVFYSINSPWGVGHAGQFLKTIMSNFMTKANTVVTFSPIPLLNKYFTHACAANRQTIHQHLTTQCPVYRFHTKNGAHLHDIIQDADRSPCGMSQSFGWQVSYKYR